MGLRQNLALSRAGADGPSAARRQQIEKKNEGRSPRFSLLYADPFKEDEPPRPSIRLSSTSTLPKFAAACRTEPARLSQLLRGELDWIVMKCLEKDRTRRYETANGLARDISRYLCDEPVEACPPSLSYRVSKFTRRYKTPLTFAAAIFCLLLAGATLSTWQAIRAKRAEAIALDSERKARAAAAVAEQAKDAESSQRQRAEANEQSALDEKNKTLASQNELRETNYASDMSLVQVAMESSQFGRARQLLNQQRPAAGQSDFRGFEWHYWQRELDRSRLRSVDAPLLAAANRISSRGWPRIFSKGAQRLVACLEYPRDSPLYTGAGLMVVFDGLTGREVVAPFDPCTDVPAGHRDIRFSMSDDGTRLAASIAVRTDGATAGQPAQITIRDGLTGSEIRRIVGPAGVAEIALSADGSRLAVEYIDQADLQNRQTASGQSGVKVWDTSTGELLKTLPLLPYTSRNRILLSPDGQRLLRQSVSRDRDNERVSYREQFQVVEVTSGTVLWDRPFPSHFSDPRRAWGWSPSGKLIVVFEVDEPDMVAKPNAQLWDSATGTTLAKLDRETVSNPSATSNLAFSADSQLLAVASTTNEIYVWKIPELPAAAASPLHVTAPYLTLQSGEEVNGIAFTADSRELQCATATSIITLDATAREDAGLGPDLMDVLFSSAISADAMKVAFGWGGSLSQKGSVWDLAANQEVFQLENVGNSFFSPSFTPDGRRVVMGRLPSAAEERLQLEIHDAQTGGLLQTIPVRKPSLLSPSLALQATIRDLVFRPDGGQFAAILQPRDEDREKQQLMAWDSASGRQLFAVPMSASLAAGVVYSQDSASLIVGTRDFSGGAAEFYDAAMGRWQKSISMPIDRIKRWFVDGPHQVLGCIVGSDFVLCDLATGKERLRVPGYDELLTYAIGPDGSRLVLGKRLTSRESELTFWSMKSGRRLLALNRSALIAKLSFSPDGNRLVATFATRSTLSQSGGKAIKIWDATPLHADAAY